MLFLLKLFYATATVYVLIRGLSYAVRALDARAKALALVRQAQANSSVPHSSHEAALHLARQCPEAVFYVHAYSECQRKAVCWLLPATTLTGLVFLMPWSL